MTDSDPENIAGGPRWICPQCGGGFPDPIKNGGRWKCPWCSKGIAKWGHEHGAQQVEALRK